MYRVRRGTKRWRKKWPLRKWFPPVLDERFCPKCRLPHQDGPMPKPLAVFTSGQMGACIYPSGGWKRNQLSIKFGRWKVVGTEFQLTGYVFADELKDLAQVTVQVRRYIRQRGDRPPRR